MKPWNVTVIETEADGTKREATTVLEHDYRDEAAVREYFKRFKHLTFVKAEPIILGGKRKRIDFEPTPTAVENAGDAAAAVIKKRSKKAK